MNDMFGIQVCRRLFESAPTTKRKRLGSSQKYSEGGMLANLIPEERGMAPEANGHANQKNTKKQSTSSSSNDKTTTSSVLADIGNYYYGKSPPRSNKELKEMRSSVMAVGFDKKDASFSVFEMLSQPHEPNNSVHCRQAPPNPSGKRRQGQGTTSRPASRVGMGTISVLATAEQINYQGVLVESKSKPISVLEVTQSTHGQGETCKATNQAMKRRGKRDHRSVPTSSENTKGRHLSKKTIEASLSASRSSSFEDVSKKTKRGGQQIVLDAVPVISTNGMDNTKPTNELQGRRIRENPKISKRKSEPKAKNETTKNVSSIRQLAEKCVHSEFEGFPSITRENIREHRKLGGPGRNELSAEEVRLPIHVDSSKITNLSMVQSATDKSFKGAEAIPVITAKCIDTTEATNDLKARKIRASKKKSKPKSDMMTIQQANSEKNRIVSSPRELTDDKCGHSESKAPSCTPRQDVFEQKKIGGPGCQVLSVEHLEVPIIDDSSKINDSSIVQLAVDVSLLEEAAITLLQLSTSKSDDSDEDIRDQVVSIRKSTARKKKTKHKYKTKRRYVEVVKKTEMKASLYRSNEPTRRSSRQVVLTQRFSPVDRRRRKIKHVKEGKRKLRYDQSKAIRSNRISEVTGDDKHVLDPLHGHFTNSSTTRPMGQSTPTSGPGKGSMDSNEFVADTSRMNVSAEPTHPPKPMTKRSTVVATGEFLPVGSTSKQGGGSSDSSNEGEVNGVVGISYCDKESTTKTATIKQKSGKGADNLKQRKSTRCKTKTEHSTPPPTTTVEDDFFDSLQKSRFMKDLPETDESDAKPKHRSVVEIDKKQDTTTKRTKSKFTRGVVKSEMTMKNKKRKVTTANTVNQSMNQHPGELDGTSALDPDGWTRLQIVSLRVAYAAVNPCSNQFWEEVANQIEGRSEEECRNKWFTLVKTPGAKKKPIVQLKGQKKNIPVQDTANEDDLFNSTPMRSRVFNDADAHGNEDQSFDIDFGSPIVVDDARGRSAMTTEYDDDMQIDASTERFGYSRTFVKNLKRDISKAGKVKPRRKICPMRETGPKGISYAVDYDELEVKGTLSPGGTMLVRTIDWNEGDNDDDIFGSDEE